MYVYTPPGYEDNQNVTLCSICCTVVAVMKTPG